MMAPQYLDFPDYTIMPPDDGLVITVHPSRYEYGDMILLGLILFAAYRLAVS